MKTMKSKLMIVLLILLSGTMFNTALFAQCKNHPMGNTEVTKDAPMPKGCCNVPDLTPDQQKQIDALHLNLVKETLSIKNQIAEKDAHLTTLSTGDNVDLTAVNKTIDEMFALKAELMKKHEAFQQDVRKLLTADQKVLFDMHHCDMKCDGPEGHEGMGEMGPGMPGGTRCGMMMKGGENPSCKDKATDGKPMGCCKDKAGTEQGMPQGAGCSHKDMK